MTYNAAVTLDLPGVTTVQLGEPGEDVYFKLALDVADGGDDDDDDTALSLSLALNVSEESWIVVDTLALEHRETNAGVDRFELSHGTDSNVLPEFSVLAKLLNNATGSLTLEVASGDDNETIVDNLAWEYTEAPRDDDAGGTTWKLRSLSHDDGALFLPEFVLQMGDDYDGSVTTFGSDALGLVDDGNAAGAAGFAFQTLRVDSFSVSDTLVFNSLAVALAKDLCPLWWCDTFGFGFSASHAESDVAPTFAAHLSMVAPASPTDEMPYNLAIEGSLDADISMYLGSYSYEGVTLGGALTATDESLDASLTGAIDILSYDFGFAASATPTDASMTFTLTDLAPMSLSAAYSDGFRVVDVDDDDVKQSEMTVAVAASAFSMDFSYGVKIDITMPNTDDDATKCVTALEMAVDDEGLYGKNKAMMYMTTGFCVDEDATDDGGAISASSFELYMEGAGAAFFCYRLPSANVMSLTGRPV